MNFYSKEETSRDCCFAFALAIAEAVDISFILKKSRHRAASMQHSYWFHRYDNRQFSCKSILVFSRGSNRLFLTIIFVSRARIIPVNLPANDDDGNVMKYITRIV